MIRNNSPVGIPDEARPAGLRYDYGWNYPDSGNEVSISSSEHSLIWAGYRKQPRFQQLIQNFIELRTHITCYASRSKHILSAFFRHRGKVVTEPELDVLLHKMWTVNAKLHIHWTLRR